MTFIAAMSSAPRLRRVPVTIPGSGDSAVTLAALVLASLEVLQPGLAEIEARCLMGGRVNPVAAGYVAGDSATSLPLAVPIGSIYEEPCTNFLGATYVRAAGAASISAVVSVYLTVG